MKHLGWFNLSFKMMLNDVKMMFKMILKYHLIVVILIWTLFWRFKFKMVIYIYMYVSSVFVFLCSARLFNNILSMFLPVYGNMKDLNIFYYHIHEVSWNYVFILLLSQSNSFFSTCIFLPQINDFEKKTQSSGFDLNCISMG